MSLLNRNRYRKKLDSLLSRADDKAFLQMVWAIDALQSERVVAASRYIYFPSQAATSDISSDFSIRKWELETLANHLLITPKQIIKKGRRRHLVCDHFSSATKAANYLRIVEDTESGMFLKNISVLLEVHRIGQRQFPWQRGYLNIMQLYRYIYIYGKGQCADYFEERYGLTVSQFAQIGLIMYAAFQQHPWINRQRPWQQLNISHSTMEKALSLLSMPISQARHKASAMIDEANAKLGQRLPTAYQPSFFRSFPIIAFGHNDNMLCAPLPQLLLLRVTAGIYYDLIGGKTHLRNDASRRFEEYSRDYIAAMLPRFNVSGSQKYRFGRNFTDTPDITISEHGSIRVAVECKATKLTFGAQFARDPSKNASVGYGELVVRA